MRLFHWKRIKKKWELFGGEKERGNWEKAEWQEK